MNTQIPKHIAIIMDGNGRWAKKRNLPRVAGHHAGVEAVQRVVRSCLDIGIEGLTLFAFSSENWYRPLTEVNFLMELFYSSLENECERLHAQQVRFRMVGDRTRLSTTLQKRIEQAEALTQSNDKLFFNLAINYGGRWDILQATKRLAAEVLAGKSDLMDIDEDRFSQYLCFAGQPPPDLFIRTSGEHRISNFMLWQLAYTELFFSEVLWPDFKHEHLEAALIAFASRERRFGRISHQVQSGV